MSSKVQNANAFVNDKTRFSMAGMPDLEMSKFTSMPRVATTFDAGELVPVMCFEVLPNDRHEVSTDFVIRQATLIAPTMDNLIEDIVAVWVPNRIINHSWKNVMGENTSGQWTAPDVQLAPLVEKNTSSSRIKIPVGSVADYYGFPTQEEIPATILQQCNDLKFRGYLECWNTLFRSQDYMPPIPYSKLNVFNGFFMAAGSNAPLRPDTAAGGWSDVPIGTKTDGAYADGAILKELYGEGATNETKISIPARKTSFSALGKPLKVCKLHDYFTSVLPSPLKGREVTIPVGDTAPVSLNTKLQTEPFDNPLRIVPGDALSQGDSIIHLLGTTGNGFVKASEANTTFEGDVAVIGSNLYGLADLSQASGVSINDLRSSAAIQQVYELLGRGGSRYQEFLDSFFGVQVNDVMIDRPVVLGHIRRDLDLFQTAQTSASSQESPQGNLAAFGYTNNGGNLFAETFAEHGYVHIFSIVRHKNVYSSLLSRDNFRRGMLDFYLPQFANLGEQPVYTREINPFLSSDKVDQVFGYQEYAAEYRYHPDRVSGYMRPGIPLSLAVWNYADPLDTGLLIADGSWLESNTAEVVRRTTATQDKDLPQFKASFAFKITSERAMPIYSVPGLDII